MTRLDAPAAFIRMSGTGLTTETGPIDNTRDTEQCRTRCCADADAEADVVAEPSGLLSC